MGDEVLERFIRSVEIRFAGAVIEIWLKVMLLSLPFGVIHRKLVGTVSILTRREKRD